MDAICSAYFKTCEHIFKSGLSLRNRTSDSVFYGSFFVAS
nr:MAG TPA: hypothetical protein [Caudoviricetes sp.]